MSKSDTTLSKKTEKFVREVSVAYCIEHQIGKLYESEDDVRKCNPVINALAFMEEVERMGYKLVRTK